MAALVSPVFVCERLWRDGDVVQAEAGVCDRNVVVCVCVAFTLQRQCEDERIHLSGGGCVPHEMLRVGFAHVCSFCGGIRTPPSFQSAFHFNFSVLCCPVFDPLKKKKRHLFFLSFPATMGTGEEEIGSLHFLEEVYSKGRK